MTQKICRICQKHFCKYTCPRCNIQYCSLDCYKKHGDRCTEGFYSEHVSNELRQTKASQEDKQRMLEILQRVQDADAAGEGPAAAGMAHEHGDDQTGGHDEDGLSDQTIAKLLAKAEDGQDLQVVLEDLTPAERAAFEFALASGELARMLLPWEPWWRSAKARDLSLSTAGTRLIQEHAQSSTDEGVQQREPSAIPAPPEAALPRLAALSRAVPSLLLQWQLVEILYAYCATVHLYQGDWASDAVGAAVAASAASAALEGHAESGTPPEPPASALLALSDCITRACLPALHGPGGHQFAMAVVDDVKTLLICGRPAVVSAITDLRRLFAAALGELKASRQPRAQKSSPRQHEAAPTAQHLQLESSAAPESDKQASGPAAAAEQQGSLEGLQQNSDRKQDQNAEFAHVSMAQHEKSEGTHKASARARGNRRLRQQLQAAECRLVYFQSWANEQPRDVYQHILEATAEASSYFEQVEAAPDASLGSIADMSNRYIPQGSAGGGAEGLGSEQLQLKLHKRLVEEVHSPGDIMDQTSPSVLSEMHGELGSRATGRAIANEQTGIDYDALD